MNNEMDFDFDNMEMEQKKIKSAVIMYDESGELMQRFVVENLLNMSVDYDKKILHAEHKDGNVYDIDFYKMVVV